MSEITPESAKAFAKHFVEFMADMQTRLGLSSQACVHMGAHMVQMADGHPERLPDAIDRYLDYHLDEILGEQGREVLDETARISESTLSPDQLERFFNDNLQREVVVLFIKRTGEERRMRGIPTEVVPHFNSRLVKILDLDLPEGDNRRAFNIETLVWVKMVEEDTTYHVQR